MANFIFTVSEVNGYAKKVLEAEDLLHNITIRGEVSNFSRSLSGHVYFTLKDEFAAIKCIWFKNSGQENFLNLKDGEKVKILADVTLYIKGGTYQYIVKRVEKDGTGNLFEEFERLKKKLSQEGLFDSQFKKALPRYPKTIGVITSETGAAIQDITRVLQDSWGNVTMRLFPVSVQGDNAAQQMKKAVEYLDAHKAADVIIIGRGGGSFEDLSCFNDESLVRQIYKCCIPVISAVGHETDFTLCDFVADVREATPSTAAKRAVPDKNSELERLSSIRHELTKKVLVQLQNKENDIAKAHSRLSRLDPNSMMMQKEQQLDITSMRLNNIMIRRFDTETARLSELKKTLKALNPNNTLKRGFAIVKDSNDNIISTIAGIKLAENVNINMHDGNIAATIVEEKDE
jgi:exodeoxyribonuclease VII large subunit